MKKIYFAGSIRGGREHIGFYKEIIRYLQKYGDVLTEHIGHEGISPAGEESMTDADIYSRDLEWLSSCDMIVADVTVPSLGVGFEISRAIALGKKVLCLYNLKADKKLSAMIAGCPEVEVREYQTIKDVENILEDYFLGT